MKKNYQKPIANLFAVSADDVLTASGSLGALSENVNRNVGTNASYGDDSVAWSKYVK